jgi:RNA polymerase sigma factor (sigma-70 family)
VADERAQFEALYNRYAHLILAYAARRTESYEDAADVLADTFTVVWRRINDVPEGDEARLWIYGVARRTLANHHRGDRRRRRLDERLQREVARVVAAAQRPRESAEIARISSAFNRLSPTDREVLTLIGWEGLHHDEVARVLGCSRARIRVRLHRARARLLRTLDAGGTDPPLESGEALAHQRADTATTAEELSP